MVDFLLIILVVICICIGYRRGLVKSAFGLGAFFVSLILSFLIYPYVKNYIGSTAIYDAVQGLVASGVQNYYPDAQSIPQNIQGFADYGQTALVNYISELVINIISFVIVLIGIRIILTILEKTLGLIANLPVIGFFNKIGGAALGVIQSLLIAFIILAIVAAVTSADNGRIYEEYISDSAIVKEMYDNNPLLELLKPSEGTEI